MKKTKRSIAKTRDFIEAPAQQDEKPQLSKSTNNKTAVIITILTITLVFALALSRGYIVVAIVNNRPIFRFQLSQALMSRYGKQTLESMISERIIKQEAQKSGVEVTQQEIDNQEQEVLNSFGGNITLDELLKFQGIAKSEFDEQIRLQLMVNKLLEKDVSVTDDEVVAYVDTNRAIMISTDEAGLKEEARQALLEQKINEKIQPWFTELKNKARIFKFL